MTKFKITISGPLVALERQVGQSLEFLTRKDCLDVLNRKLDYLVASRVTDIEVYDEPEEGR